MTSPKSATCHCILGHPNKNKFLVIRHTGGWHPPTLKFPAGMSDYKAKVITDGMNQKYGLKVRVLRPLMTSPMYHCLELELLDSDGSKKLDAVWMDQNQYLKYRSAMYTSIDPIETWFEEKERGRIPDLRPAWFRPGWFGQADHWIQFQMDRLGLQATGSLEQVRLGSKSSCLLRIPANNGFLYFKASHPKPPAEAPLTMAVADQWPDYVTRPLAVELQRNWMLFDEFPAETSELPPVEEFPLFTGAMAKIQVESASNVEDWLALGCPRRDLDVLQQRISEESDFTGPLLAGEHALTPYQLHDFVAKLAGSADACRKLQAFKIPDTLVHVTFRDDNLAFCHGSRRIFDWSGTVIGHPFFVLMHMCAHREVVSAEDSGDLTFRPISKGAINSLLGAYFKPFEPYGTASQLANAMDLTISLFPLWKYCLLRNELDWTETGSPAYLRLAMLLRSTAREMISA